MTINQRWHNITLIVLCLMCFCININAQEEKTNSNSSAIELFMGADLNYRDNSWDKVYDVLLNLTPGVKWNAGQGWRVSAQALIPVYNSYGSYYSRVRLNVANVSKEFNWGKFNLKPTVGLFTRERYGIDVKSMYHMKDWLSFECQLGYTGFCSMADGWKCSHLSRICAVGGANFYIRDWQSQVRLRAGRFLYEDFGVTCDIMRHFKHCSVGLYGKYSDSYENINGGFKVVMMIPPYHYKKARKVRFRPQSNFRLTYNLRGDAFGVKMYDTDPEENERNGWFDADSKQWEE